MKSGHLQYASNQCRANVPFVAFYLLVYFLIVYFHVSHSHSQSHSRSHFSFNFSIVFFLFIIYLRCAHRIGCYRFFSMHLCDLVLLPYDNFFFSFLLFVIFNVAAMYSIQVLDINWQLHKRNLNSIYNGFLLSVIVNW